MRRKKCGCASCYPEPRERSVRLTMSVRLFGATHKHQHANNFTPILLHINVWAIELAVMQRLQFIFLNFLGSHRDAGEDQGCEGNEIGHGKCGVARAKEAQHNHNFHRIYQMILQVSYVWMRTVLIPFCRKVMMVLQF